VVRFRKDGTFVKEWGKKGSGPARSASRTPSRSTHAGACSSAIARTTASRSSIRTASFLAEWRQFGRPSGITITRDDTIYVTDSESGPDTGAHELPGIKKGIRIGSAKDGSVRAFIEDMESTVADHSGAEGVGVDAQGNVYGAVVRRQMLERHVLTK
jgi:sugar lactone lactonase YvrE